MTGKYMPTQIQNAKIIELSTRGLKADEICKELGVSPSTVTRALNSDQAKEVLAQAKLKLQDMITDALNVYRSSLGKSDTDMTNSLKAAKDILKNFGILKDQVDLVHSFPKPTIIKRIDGVEVVLGVEEKEDE